MNDHAETWLPWWMANHIITITSHSFIMVNMMSTDGSWQMMASWSSPKCHPWPSPGSPGGPWVPTRPASCATGCEASKPSASCRTRHRPGAGPGGERVGGPALCWLKLVGDGWWWLVEVWLIKLMLKFDVGWSFMSSWCWLVILPATCGSTHLGDTLLSTRFNWMIRIDVQKLLTAELLFSFATSHTETKGYVSVALSSMNHLLVLQLAIDKYRLNITDSSISSSSTLILKLAKNHPSKTWSPSQFPPSPPSPPPPPAAVLHGAIRCRRWRGSRGRPDRNWAAGSGHWN